MNQYTDSAPLSQDTDSAIVAMLDELLLQDNLAIISEDDGYHLVDFSPNNEPWGKIIDRYDTWVAAYRGAIDCLIELAIEGWEKGGQS